MLKIDFPIGCGLLLTSGFLPVVDFFSLRSKQATETTERRKTSEGPMKMYRRSIPGVVSTGLLPLPFDEPTAKYTYIYFLHMLIISRWPKMLELQRHSNDIKYVACISANDKIWLENKQFEVNVIEPAKCHGAVDEWN